MRLSLWSQVEDPSRERCILHPHDEPLNLQEYAARPEILERCRKMTYLFVDSETNAVVSDTIPVGVMFLPALQLDFFTFNAFSPHILQILLAHHQRLRTVKVVKRGRKFENFSTGLMHAIGFRKPMGGCQGSAYSAYEGMQAATLDGLETLFDHAEVIYSSPIYCLQD